MAGNAEIQGSFTLSLAEPAVSGAVPVVRTTVALAPDAPASILQAAVTAALPSGTSAVVTRAANTPALGHSWTVTFSSDSKLYPALSATSALQGTSVPVPTVTTAGLFNAVTCVGKPSAIHTMLNGALYRSKKHWNSHRNGGDQLTISMRDSSRPIGSQVVTRELPVYVSAVNDAPVIVLPTVSSAVEDTKFAVSGLAILDPDVEEGVDGGLLEVSLTSASGVMHLGIVDGLLFSIGDGSASSAMAFKSSQANANAALASLTFTGDANWNSAVGSTSEVQEVKTSAARFLLNRQSVTTSVVSGGISGGSFVLQLVVGGVTSDTGNIAFNAADSVVAAAVKGLGCLSTFPQLTVEVKRTDQVVEQGTPSYSSGGVSSVVSAGYVWEITVLNPPAGMPAFTIKTNALTPSTAKVAVAPVFSGLNTLGGFFTLEFGGERTDPLQYDASAAAVEAALSLLSTIGSVAVSSSGVSTKQGAREWAVTFKADGSPAHLGDQPSLVAGSSLMTGVGASITVSEQQAGAASPARVTVTANDLGNSGTGSALSSSGIVSLLVAPANDAPIWVTPQASIVLDEDTSVKVAGVMITDADIEGRALEITVSAPSGAITLSSVAGLSFTTGKGNGNGVIVFRAAVADVNAALDYFTYAPTAHSNGQHEVTLQAKDAATVATAAIVLTVVPSNDAPVITAPPSVVANEDTAIVLGGVRVDDPDILVSSQQVISVTLSAGHGTMSFAQATRNLFQYVAGDGANDQKISIVGALASVNQALATLTYLGDKDWFGVDFIQILADDLGESGAPDAVPASLTASAQIKVTVKSVNDAPRFAIPSPATHLSVAEDTIIQINGMSVSDVDLSAGAALNLLLTSSHGELSLGSVQGLSVLKAPRAGDLSVRGSLFNLNNALKTVVFKAEPDWNGIDTVFMTASDVASTGVSVQTAVASFEVTVTATNDAPTIAYSPVAAIVVAEGTVAAITGLSVADVDVAENVDGGSLTVHLSATNGSLSLNVTAAALHTVHFLAGSGSGDALMSMRGTAGSLNALLANLRFSAQTDWYGNSSIQITVSDGGNSGVGGVKTAKLAVPLTVTAVNSAPVVSGPSMPISVVEDKSIVIPGVSVMDPDIGSAKMQVTVSTDNKGFLSIATKHSGLKFVQGTGSGDLSIVVEGNQTDINLALADLRYRSAQDFYGQDQLHIFASDQGHSGAGGVKTGKLDVQLEVVALSDAPSVSLSQTMATQPAVQGVATAISGVSLKLVDTTVPSESIVEFTCSAKYGSISVLPQPGVWVVSDGTTIGTATSKSSVVLRGDVSMVNKALNASFLQYTSASAYAGVDTIVVEVSDMKSASAHRGLATVSMAVTTATVAPKLVLPEEFAVAEDTDFFFQQAAILAADANTVLDVTLATSNGMVSLKPNISYGNLNFSTGDGHEDLAMSFRGFPADVNDALAQVSYRGALNYNGLDSLLVTVNDGALSVQHTVDIIVNPVNDAPMISGGTSAVSALQDKAVTIPGLFVTDVDASESFASMVSVTIAAVHGNVSIAKPSGLNMVTSSASGALSGPSIHFTGSLADVNRGLLGLVYKGAAGWSGTELLSIQVDDLGNSGVGGNLSAAISVPVAVGIVNSPLAIATPAVGFATNEDKPVLVNGVVVTSPTAGQAALSVSIRSSLKVATFALSSKALGRMKSSSASAAAHLQFSAQLADLNFALSELVYEPTANWNGDDEIVIDVANTVDVSSTASVRIPVAVTGVNDLPQVTLPTAVLAIDEDSWSSVAGASVADADFLGHRKITGILQVAVSALYGTVRVAQRPAGLYVTNGPLDSSSGSSQIEFRGTTAVVNAALQQLEFLSANNTPGTDTLLVNASDLGCCGAGSTNAGVVATLAIEVDAVNDAPQIMKPSQVQKVAEGVDMLVYRAAGLQIADVDIGSNLMHVTLSTTHGLLTLGSKSGLKFAAGSGVADKTMSFRASLTDANAALKVLRYRSALDYSGFDEIAVTVNDGGHASQGKGGAKTTTATMQLEVTSVNTPPSVSAATTTYSIVEDAVLPMTGISVSDDDAKGMLDITVAASHSGELAVQQLTTSATYIDPVQLVTVVVPAGTAGGTFTLSLDLTSTKNWGIKTLATTAAIQHNAVAMRDDEVLGRRARQGCWRLSTS